MDLNKAITSIIRKNRGLKGHPKINLEINVENQFELIDEILMYNCPPNKELLFQDGPYSIHIVNDTRVCINKIGVKLAHTIEVKGRLCTYTYEDKHPEIQKLKKWIKTLRTLNFQQI